MSVRTSDAGCGTYTLNVHSHRFETRRSVLPEQGSARFLHNHNATYVRLRCGGGEVRRLLR